MQAWLHGKAHLKFKDYGSFLGELSELEASNGKPKNLVTISKKITDLAVRLEAKFASYKTTPSAEPKP